MKISQNGINLVKRFEGRRLTAYKPVAAVRVEKEDDAMVEKSKIIINGKEVPVKRILKDGVNFIVVRDVGKIFNCEVSNKGNVPVLKSK